MNQQGFIYGNQADNTQLAGYPYTHGRAEINYAGASGARIAFGTMYYGSLNSFQEPAFTLSDVAITAPLAHNLRAQFSVQNLFNHDDYRTLGEYAYGYAPPQVGGGGFAPNTLYFAPPRQLTLQTRRSIGR